MADNSVQDELERLAEQLADDEQFHVQFYKMFAEKCDPYVPYITGALATNITINKDGITYEQPYAQEVYESNNRHNLEYHPLASSYWDEVAFENHKDENEAETVKIATERLEELANGEN